VLEQELSVRFLAGDPVEIKTAYNGLMRTGSELGVDMPITKSFQTDMEEFAKKGY